MPGPKHSSLRRRLAWYRHGRGPQVEDDEQPLLPPAASSLSVGASSGFDSSLSCLDTFKLGTETTTLLPSSTPSHAEKPATHSQPPESHPYPDSSLVSQYCTPCQRARSSPGYSERVAKLMERLYCVGCQCEHPAILFSHSSRSNKFESRSCIGHEGFYTVCPHLKFSLEDIESWKATGESMELRCHQAACPCPGTAVEYHASKGSIFPDDVQVSWTATLDDTASSDTSWERCIAKIDQLHTSYPALFCPSFQVTPDGLFQREQFEDDWMGNGSEDLGCVCFCGFGIHHDTIGQRDQRVHASCTMPLEHNRQFPMPERWIKLIDPDSYGHFSDPDT
ncbi:hypothetical protein FDECE_5196 [Fusarium decemcellulare]|nr:hypothetical protein FDECE_5196 [Fusarium decemcellulare]